MKKGFTIIELLIAIGSIGLLSSIALPKIENSISAAKASQVHGNLYNLQGMIDLFNVAEGHYPVYGEDIGTGSGKYELSDNLKKYYTKGEMPETPSGGGEVSKIKNERKAVYEWASNDHDQLKGGWLYDESTGRLYARLVENAYNQGNIWITDSELKEGTVSSKSYDDISLTNGQMWFTDNFLDEFSFETSFKINGGGRMEIFLDVNSGVSDTETGINGATPTGYMLRIHPIRGEMYLLKVNEYENNGDNAKNSPNTSNGNEEIIETVKLNKMSPPIKISTWKGEDVPVSVQVNNSGTSKSLSMSIGGQEITFSNGSKTVEYQSDSIRTTVGVGTSLNRSMEVSNVTINND